MSELHFNTFFYITVLYYFTKMLGMEVHRNEGASCRQRQGMIACNNNNRHNPFVMVASYHHPLPKPACSRPFKLQKKKKINNQPFYKFLSIIVAVYLTYRRVVPNNVEYAMLLLCCTAQELCLYRHTYVTHLLVECINECHCCSPHHTH